MKDLFQLVFLNWWSDNSVHPACQNQLDMPHQTRQLVFTSLIVIKLTLNESSNVCVQKAFLIWLKIDFFTWKITRKQIRILRAEMIQTNCLELSSLSENCTNTTLVGRITFPELTSCDDKKFAFVGKIREAKDKHSTFNFNLYWERKMYTSREELNGGMTRSMFNNGLAPIAASRHINFPSWL